MSLRTRFDRRPRLLGTTLKFARCFEAEKQHQKYGPIVRLAPNFLSIKDEAAIKTVYQPSWYKSIWYKVRRSCIAQKR